MQGFGALVMSALLSASSPLVLDAVRQADVSGSSAGEAYVAELDADWNVTREVRVACPAEAGCAVDLDLGDAGLAAVHVRFDPLRAGAVAVTSRLEDRQGHASTAQNESLPLDRSGFGAGHYEAKMDASAPAGRIIMMAVKLPGWTAPAGPAPSAGAERT